MIAAAIVCAAAFAQAATVQWQSGTIYVASDAAGTTGTGNDYKANASTRVVTAYIYALTAAEYSAAQAMDTATLYNTYYGEKTPTASKTTIATGVANHTAYTVDDNSTVYALALFVDEKNANLPEGKDAFVKAALASAITGTTNTQVSNMIGDHVVGDGKWTAVPVPEPTSGLLLLLGVAGMALRRRRA